jgi:hypothetical protein
MGPAADDGAGVPHLASATTTEQRREDDTMSTPSTTLAPSTEARRDHTWLRLVWVSIALLVPALVGLAIVEWFFTTVAAGRFEYAADYWLTGSGLPIALGGIGLVLGVHRLQHGADGRLGTVGTALNTIALAELFVQLLASVVVGAELRWGPSYIVFTLLTTVGVALVAVGSWRTEVLPRWMLGVWPAIWLLGSFASFSPMPVVLAGYLVLLGVTLTRRVGAHRS